MDKIFLLILILCPVFAFAQGGNTSSKQILYVTDDPTACSDNRIRSNTTTGHFFQHLANNLGTDCTDITEEINAGVTGTGTTGTLTKFTGNEAIGDSHFSETSTAAALTLPLVVTQTNPSVLTTGIGTGLGMFSSTVNTAVNGTQYLGVGGLSTVSNTSGSGQSLEASGVNCAVRIAAANTDNLTSITEGLPACYGSVRALAGATGTASLASVYNGQLINSASGFTFTTGSFFKAQAITNSGTITNANGLWTPSTAFNGIATNTTHVLLGADAQPAGNFSVYDASGYRSNWSGQMSVVPTTAILGDGTEAFFKVTGTIPSTLTVGTNGVEFVVTGASSGASGVGTLMANLNAGYTGSGSSNAIGATNFSAGTGADFVAGTFNSGTNSLARGTTVGDNVGMTGTARGGLFNIGVSGKSVVAKNSGANIGVAGFAINTGTSPVLVAGYFGLQATKPTFTTAALMADNGAIAAPIFVARDNGTAVLTVDDGGATTLTSSLAIGSGTPILKHLSATATLDFASLVAIGCEDLTITITGAASGDTVALGVPNGSVVANGQFTAWISAADTATVRFCTFVSGNPASGTFRIDAWQH